MKLSPHLSFKGQCQEAMEFYQRCLGAKIQFMLTYGNAPCPTEWRRNGAERFSTPRWPS